MKFLLSERATHEYDALSLQLQASVDKQLAFLLRDLRHPSLRAKKYNESLGVWQGRINRTFSKTLSYRRVAVYHPAVASIANSFASFF